MTPRSENPLKDVLRMTRPLWDHSGTRSAVRENFSKVVNCRTGELGAEVYASSNGEKSFPHPCRSRSCPSCGYRATLLWQREQFALLPDIPYAGINFTMPKQLWSIFQQNRHLLHDLPILGAEVITQWAKAKYGVRVLVLVVQHTFGSDLKFNPHLHTLVSASGIHDASPTWKSKLSFDKESLMNMWRYAVITLLRRALAMNVLAPNLPEYQLKALLTAQYERRWIIHRDPFMSKRQFLGYAARYVRRPPIAQRRLIRVDSDNVEFVAKQRKRPTVMHCSASQFVERLAEHVPDRYRHNIRYFGLLAPRTKHQSRAAIFALLRQEIHPRPRRLGWRQSLIKYFGKDPLVDRTGNRMTWTRREKSAPYES